MTGYQVLRRRPLSGESRLLVYVADTGSTATGYTDGDATVAGDQYNYRVKALRGNQKSGMSNLAKVNLPDSASTPTPTATPTPTSEPTPTATPTPTPEPTPTATPEPTPTATPTPTPEPTPKPKPAGTPTPTPTPTGSSECDVPPASVSSELISDSSAVVLTWVTPTDCTPQGYSVFRMVVDEEDTDRRIAKTGPSVLTYTDTSVEAGQTYRYRIRSNNIGPKTDATEIAVPEARGSGTRAEGNDTIADATDLGNWDDVDTDTMRDDLGNPNSDRVNYYKFALTKERYVRVMASEQETAPATIDIVDADDNVIFPGNSSGWHGSGSDKRYTDQVYWERIGPGTWYIRMMQQSNRDNYYLLQWWLEDAPEMVDDDCAPGIWTDCTVTVFERTDGTIRNANNVNDEWRKLDRDWMKVNLGYTALWNFKVRRTGSAGDPPLLLIWDAYGRTVTYGDKKWGTAVKQLGPGEYHLEVRNRGPNVVTYQVEVRPHFSTSEPDGVDFSFANPGYIRVGDSVTGLKETPNGTTDPDVFRVDLRAGRTYRFEVKGSGDPGGGGTFDTPAVHLFEIGAIRPLAGDNPQFHQNAVLEYTITSTDAYEIAANFDQANAGPGTYTLTVTDISVTVEGDTDLPGSADTRGYVQVDGDRATGEIDSQRDADAFKVELIAGRSYQIDVWGSNLVETGGTLPIPLVSLYSPTYFPLQDPAVVEQTSGTGTGVQSTAGITDAGGGRGNNARIQIDVHVTGTYHIQIITAVRSDPPSIGTYTMFVTTTQQ